MIQLDFNIPTAIDRMNYIKNFDLKTLSKKELQTCTNYVLYGKDEDGTSCVDRGEIQIKSKYSTFARKPPESLEQLLESPMFNEDVSKVEPTIYKKVKPTIDKEKVKDIPEMQELWQQIERLQSIYDENIGKKPKRPETPTLSSIRMYHLRHELAELRNDQYFIVDRYFPKLLPIMNRSKWYEPVVSGHMNYEVLPRGTMKSKNNPYFTSPRKDKTAAWARTPAEEQLIRRNVHIDFMNKEHVYYLILYYESIRGMIEEIPDSPLHGLLWTLDYYIEKANLNEQQTIILECKKQNLMNKTIAAVLKEKLSINRQENYISTLWNKVCVQITEAAELDYDEWLCKDYDKAWKKCNCCGIEKLRDARNFIRRASSSDGFAPRCKKCDKEVRRKKKEEKALNSQMAAE